MSEFFLFLFPIAITTILVWGAGVRSKRACGGEAWDLEQAKSLQAFAALMIILHHMVQRITDCGGVNKGPVTAWNSFGILFTSIFFFFSGFGLYKSQRDKEQYLKNFLRHRLPMILIPFLLTNIIYLIFVSGGRIGGVTDVFTSIFGFTLMNGNAWFIVELVFLYLAYYVCFRWSRSERAAICKLTVFTVLLVSVSLLLGHDGSKVGGHWFMGEWWYNTTLIFIMGFLFGKYEDPLKAFLLRRWKLLLPISVVLLIGWYILMEFVQGRFGYYREWEGHPGYPEKLLTLLVQLILCMLFVFVLLLVNLKIEFRNPVLTFLGGISLEVYLIHDVFRKGLPGGTGGQMPDLLYLALTYALTILSAWVLSKGDHFLIDRYHRLGRRR